MFDQGACVYWNGPGWGTIEGVVPILPGTFGKPSPRRLHDGTRALATEYTGGSTIVAPYGG